WWRDWPRANVAIATGNPGPDVLDVDRKADGDGFAAFGRLQRAGMLTGAAMLLRTRSGGVHLYFTGTSQRKGALPRHRLDYQPALEKYGPRQLPAEVELSLRKIGAR